MTNAVILIVAMIIIYQGYMISRRLKETRSKLNDLKKANEDLNVEFGSVDGIELVKKQYPDLELKDDHRTGLEDANKS